MVKDWASINPTVGDCEAGQGEFVRAGQGGFFSKLVSKQVLDITIMGLDPFELNVAVMASE